MNRDGHGSLWAAVGRMCAFLSARAKVHSSLRRRGRRAACGCRKRFRWERRGSWRSCNSSTRSFWWAAREIPSLSWQNWMLRA